MPADVKTKVEDGVAKVREVLDSEDLEAIRKATEELNEVVQEVGAAAYQAGDPSVGAAGGEPGVGPEDFSTESSGDAGDDEGEVRDDEDVVDGEFTNA